MYVVLAEPQTPFNGVGAASRVAEQPALLPPLEPRQVQLELPPAEGKLGDAGLALPTEQIESEPYDVEVEG